jgi:chromosome segregation ATPase
MTDDTTEASAADPVELVKADIEATRAELQETVDELSDRLNPKKQLSHAAESLSETTKRAASEAGSTARHGVAQAHDAAKDGFGRARHAASDRRRQVGVLGVTMAVVGLAVWWRRGRS